MKRDPGKPHRETGAAGFVLLIVLLLLVIVPAGCVAFKMRDRTAPEITVRCDVAALGRAPVDVVIEADEPKYGVRDLRASFVQGQMRIALGESTHPSNPWWRLWRKEIRSHARLDATIGRDRIPELKEGTASIEIEATNDSWAGYGHGRSSTKTWTIPVLLTPPRVEVLSAQHYITQGGSECVVYRVSQTASTSGVRFGAAFFRGYPMPGETGGSGENPRKMFAIFAYPYDAPAGAAPFVVASDAAGNEAKASFTYKLFPRVFRQDTIELNDAFLGRVVPAILSQTPTVTSQGDLLKDFLQINGPVRRENAAELVHLGQGSRPERLWSGPFLQLGGSAVEASFADHRSYRYHGQVVDRQDHLGFDLASTEHSPVEAAGRGVVVKAAWFGIYGNTVILDHGCGLMTLYAHLSSIDVHPGETIERGATLGLSGETGLAGGDHLHFSVLVQGVPVNPVEWWDAHWIHDRIDAKLGGG